MNALYEEHLISEKERDSMVHWLTFPDASRQTSIFGTSPYNLDSPEGLLQQMYLFGSDSSFSLIPEYLERIESGKSQEEVCNDPFVKRYHLLVYGAPAPGVSFFDSLSLTPLPDSLADRFNKTVVKLQRTGLVSPDVARTVPYRYPAIYFPADLLSVLAEKMHRERIYPLIRATEIQKARSLVEAGIMTDDGFKHLQLDYKANEVKGDFGMLPYCQYSCNLQELTWPDNPIPTLQNIFQRIADQMPGRGISNIQVKEERYTYPNYIEDIYMPEDHFLVSMDYKGKSYSQAFFFFEGELSAATLSPTGYHEVFNQLLAENGSDYRLFNVMHYLDDGQMDATSLGVVYLTEVQNRTWDQLFFADTLLPQFLTYPSMTTERFDDFQSPSRITGILSELESVGLMNHLDEAAKKKVLEVLLKTPIQTSGDILLMIPDLVYPVPYYLPERPDAPYAAVMTDLARLSHGTFSPTNIKDGYNAASESAEFTVSFKLKKKFKIAVSKQAELMDVTFFNSLHDCLKQNGSVTQLYNLHFGTMVIWLNDAQYQTVMRVCEDLFSEDH